MALKNLAGYAISFALGGALIGGVAYITTAPMSQSSAVSQLPESSPSSPDPIPGIDDRELTPIEELQVNTMVHVSGEVTRVTDEDEFILADSTGEIKVFTSSRFFVAEPGERVVVRAFVDDGLVRELYAQEVFHEDGSVTSISTSH